MDSGILLVILLAVPFVGGLLCWLVERIDKNLPRWVGLLTMLTVLGLALYAWATGDYSLTLLGPEHKWVSEFQAAWIPRFGISFHLALDGLSLLLTLLTGLLGVMAVACSWKEIFHRSGFFYMNLMWNFFGVIGVFLAVDLFLFFFFWEMMLVPMFFLIALWGHDIPHGPNRLYAAIKYFMFTQASGLLMLIAILALVFVHYQSTGVLTFDYDALLGTAMSSTVEFWIMLGFFFAFLVKLPSVPFHTWLPDAHGQAPTAGSVDLAGVMLKTAAYGFIRYGIAMFPEASAQIAPYAMWLGVFSILWGAALSFAQNDMKRLVAYMSVSHMGFILVGVYAGTAQALQGVMITMLSHGISSAGLFILTGEIYERLHTRDFRNMGGLWGRFPYLPPIALFFAMASLGLPGMGNFVGEFLILLGTFKADPAVAVGASLGLITAICYALIYLQRAYYGPPQQTGKLLDLNRRELATLATLMAVLLWLGIHPNEFLHTSAATMEATSHVYLQGSAYTGVATR